MRDCPCPGYHMRISLGLGPRDGEVPRVPHTNGGHARAYRAGLQACPTFKTSCVIGLFNTATRNPVPTACMPPDGHGARQTWGGSWPKGTVPGRLFFRRTGVSLKNWYRYTKSLYRTDFGGFEIDVSRFPHHFRQKGDHCHQRPWQIGATRRFLTKTCRNRVR